jgi:ring-1,2-phenylacetyl-CoA epoxidase subunit PaaB
MNRLGLPDAPVAPVAKSALDQFGTYEALPLLARSQAPAPGDADDTAAEEAAYAAGEEDYDIFHLKKRGKAHQHVGKVRANSPADALQVAKAVFGEQRPVVNVWAVRSAEVLRSDDEDRDIWATTPEKKYRDAISYKVQDRIEKFKAENPATH